MPVLKRPAWVRRHSREIGLFALACLPIGLLGGLFVSPTLFVLLPAAGVLLPVIALYRGVGAYSTGSGATGFGGGGGGGDC